jgi:light-regulated signal transduction histidine kinase (bacteriophytochrome)
LQAAVEECGAEIVLQPLPTIVGHQQQLVLLFQNLIGNAVKFRAADRKVRVEVGARRQDADWLFWVRDNGIGVEEKYLKRIFGLGERLHSSSRYPGTGFGLTICEKIVVGHGGRIWAESQLDHGTTFFFTLPQNQRMKDEG